MALDDDILEAVDTRIQKYIHDLKFDKTAIGVIKQNNLDGSYQVEINDVETKVFARDGLTLNINDVVCVRVLNNNYSQKYIDCKRPF